MFINVPNTIMQNYNQNKQKNFKRIYIRIKYNLEKNISLNQVRYFCNDLAFCILNKILLFNYFILL